jgi:hypothetical protein
MGSVRGTCLHQSDWRAHKCSNLCILCTCTHIIREYGFSNNMTMTRMIPRVCRSGRCATVQTIVQGICKRFIESCKQRGYEEACMNIRNSLSDSLCIAQTYACTESSCAHICESGAGMCTGNLNATRGDWAQKMAAQPTQPCTLRKRSSSCRAGT